VGFSDTPRLIRLKSSSESTSLWVTDPLFGSAYDRYFTEVAGGLKE